MKRIGRPWLTRMAVIASLLGAGPVMAGVGDYDLFFSVNATGNTIQGQIAPADIAVGDQFRGAFSLDLFTLQNAGGPPGQAVFNQAALSASTTRDAGNSGAFAPDILGFNNQVTFQAWANNTTLMHMLFLNPSFSQPVAYTATENGIFNNSGTAYLSQVDYSFILDVPFSNYGDGALLLNYLGYPIQSAFGSLVFDPDVPVVPYLLASGPVTVVPESSTIFAGVLATLVLLVLLKRRAGRREG